MSITYTDTKISTVVCIAELSCHLDLDAIYNNISINNVIVGKKIGNDTIGDMKNKKSFYNQLTLKVYLEEYKKEVNNKIFSNKKNFQITGIKNKEQALLSIKNIINLMIQIEGENKIYINIQNNLILNKIDIDKSCKNENSIQKRYNSIIKIYGKIPNQKYYKIVGEIKENKIYFTDEEGIKKQVCCLYDYLCDYTQLENIQEIYKYIYVDIKHKNFYKNLYNSYGEIIGNIYYKFNAVKKNLILYKSTFILVKNNIYKILNKNSKEVGNLIVDFNEEKVIILDKNLDFIYQKYYAISSENVRNNIHSGKIFENFETKINLEIANINSNFSIDLQGNSIDRNKLSYILNNCYNLDAYYNQDSKYHAINVKIYYTKDFQLTKLTDKECEYKISVSIFKNGKIIIFGCRDFSHINIPKNFIIKIFGEVMEEIIIKEKEDNFNTNNNINMWDLI